MTKLRIYQDVDGVLNQFPRSNTVRAWGENEEGRALGYTIQWSPQLLQAIDDLDGEVVWLTTWLNHATKELAELLDWGHDFRVLSYTDEDAWMFQRVASITWKTNALIADQKTDPSPFVWLDDENGDKQRQVAEELGGLAITPDPCRGITPKDMALVREYAEANK